MARPKRSRHNAGASPLRFDRAYAETLRSKLREGGDLLERCVLWPRLRHHLGSLSGQRVLECGCGFGQTTRLLLESRRIELTAVDVSDELLHLAAEVFHGDRRVHFRPADITELPFGPSTYDVVFSAFVLDNMPDEAVAAALRETRRVLRPGGRAVHVILHPAWLMLKAEDVRREFLDYGSTKRVAVDRAGRRMFYRIRRPIEWYLQRALGSRLALTGIEAVTVPSDPALPARYKARTGAAVFEILCFSK